MFKVYQCIFAISLLSPIRKGRGTSFEQIWITFTQGCFVPRFVEIGPVVLKKKMFKVCICILAISLLSPLEKEHDPSFEQIWIPITQGCFLPSLVEIGPVVLEKMKMWKFYRRTDRQTDRRRTTGDQESSLELSAHVRLKRVFFSYTRRLPCCLYDVYNVKGIKKFRKGSRARTSIAWCSFYSKPIKWQRVFFI